jgi:hypothetical protein
MNVIREIFEIAVCLGRGWINGATKFSKFKLGIQKNFTKIAIKIHFINPKIAIKISMPHQSPPPRKPKMILIAIIVQLKHI